MSVNYQEVGRRIAQRRHALGLKQAEVNEMADLSDKYLSHIETARTTPSIEVLVRICKALNTTPDYVLLGAVEDEENIEALLEKIKLLKSDKQRELLSNFVDWLIAQDL